MFKNKLGKVQLKEPYYLLKEVILKKMGKKHLPTGKQL